MNIQLSKAKVSTLLSPHQNLLALSYNNYLSPPLPDDVCVGEYERVSDVEADSDDVLGVLHGQSDRVLQGQVLPEKLLIVCQLNHQGHPERLL